LYNEQRKQESCFGQILNFIFLKLKQNGVFVIIYEEMKNRKMFSQTTNQGISLTFFYLI